ncbi:MAG: carbohydrate-binding domain-containing protein [Firmicutes bacterium]|nr:carbohydrate-binding domain-containing protein [Bacillota bacterium]
MKPENKKKTWIQKAAALILAIALIIAPAAVFADSTDALSVTETGTATQAGFIRQIAEWIRSLFQSPQQGDVELPADQLPDFLNNEQPPELPDAQSGATQMPGQMGNAQTADSPSEIQTSDLTSNSAEDLTADYANAETIVMSEENSEVTIKEAGTYIVTGSASDGSIKVKKGTTGVVLILKDLTLTSTTGATLSLNKGTETKIIIEGTVTLTDAEDIANEETDDFDGAAIKAKAGSSTVLTGTGTLNVNGNAKNGIKVSGTDADDTADGYGDASFLIDGSLTVNVTAANDGINSGTDLTIKSGTINVSAGDDGIKADYILTIGEEGTAGPTINIKKSAEGLEGATINICSGSVDITASDDGINAANSDLTGYTYSLNIMGGTVNISSGADGIDSNGNVNITGGLTTIVKAASNGGEGGLDYQGSCYIADGCLVNPYGTTMDSGMGGQIGGFGGHGQMGNWNNSDMPDSNSGATQQMPQNGHGHHGPMNGQFPEAPQN